jgi:hypothetical protein
MKRLGTPMNFIENDTQHDQALIFARAGADDRPPQKPGPFRIVQQAMAGLAARIDELTRRTDAINVSRTGWFKRLDLLEAKVRDLNKRVVGEAPPPMRTVIQIGPEEPTSDGGLCRRLQIGDASIYVAVVVAPASPSIDDATAPFDPDPAPEITLRVPAYDSDR